MKKILVFVFILSVCLFVEAKLINSRDANEVENYQYKGINGEEHDIEVHFPNTAIYAGKRPGVVFFHGGGWRRGDMAQFRGMCDYFASRGMVAITANYSMHTAESQEQLNSDESRKTVCVIDGKSVIRWVKNNAQLLGIDSSKVAAGGASAGGHIAVLSMMDEEHNNPNDPLEISTDVKAFLLFCPAFTLKEKDKTPEVNVFNHMEKSFPPSIFIVGETDNWEKASDVLAGDLVRNGNELQYWMAEEQGHMFYRNGNWIDATIKKADEFLVSIGLLEGQSPLDYPVTGESLISIDYIKTGSRSWKPGNSAELKISPNPVEEVLHVHSVKQLSDYKIIDLSGKTVKTGIIEKDNLNVRQLCQGMYVMNVEGYKSGIFYKK